LTRIVTTAVGRRLSALPPDRKVEILGVAGAGKSTVARLLGKEPGFARAEFIHTRKPSHLFQVARSIPRLMPILLGGIARRPRISWPELKLLVYVTRWRLFLGRRKPAPGTVLLFDQGPLYALVRLKAEGKPFTSRPAFEDWSEEMLRGWASELNAVIWLDAADAVLWKRINDRSQGHKKKGEGAEAGHRFIARYRRTFDGLLRRMEELGGPPVLRFDTGTATAEQIVETLGPSLLTARSAAGDPSAPVPGSEREEDRHGR
jgi:broad-specificity NMP kinase